MSLQEASACSPEIPPSRQITADELTDLLASFGDIEIIELREPFGPEFDARRLEIKMSGLRDFPKVSFVATEGENGMLGVPPEHRATFDQLIRLRDEALAEQTQAYWTRLMGTNGIKRGTPDLSGTEITPFDILESGMAALREALLKALNGKHLTDGGVRLIFAVQPREGAKEEFLNLELDRIVGSKSSLRELFHARIRKDGKERVTDGRDPLERDIRKALERFKEARGKNIEGQNFARADFWFEKIETLERAYKVVKKWVRYASEEEKARQLPAKIEELRAVYESVVASVGTAEE